MTQYAGLSEIYDMLMSGIDYDRWAGYIDGLLRLHDAPPVVGVLDLACGTGSTTLALARRGFHVTGLDLSGEMLRVAEEKARLEGLQADFIQADMRDFRLPAPVELAVAFQDGLNYLPTREDLLETFCCVAESLGRGGFFIFDINCVEKLPAANGEATVVETEEFTLIYQSSFVREDTWEINVTGFLPAGNGLWRRFSETHRERSIDGEEVRDTLEKAGFKLLGVYGAFTMEPPAGDTRRVFYVARKE